MRQTIINAAIGHWYPKGQDRLVRSLIHHGWAGEITTWKDIWPNNNYDKSCPYNIKAAAFEAAIQRGFTHIFWVDSSMWAIRNPQPLFNIINDHGIYVETNGFNCAQECSDNCLGYFGIHRDEAEKMPMCSSGLLGINITNPLGKEFIDSWITAAKDGAFKGSRFHDNQSADPRFQHHRQDQSAASIILNIMGVKMHPLGTRFVYYPNQFGTHENENTIFQCQGM